MPDQKKQTLSVPDVAPSATAPAADPALSEHGKGVSKEEFDELKAQNEDLVAANTRLHADFEALMAEIRSSRRAPDAHVRDPAATDAEPVEGDEPLFMEDEPHGLVTGDSEVGFVQNGHQFSRDKRYIATEKYRGVPRAFNPRLVGVVRRPKTAEVN
jgi:hypothetical protein